MRTPDVNRLATPYGGDPDSPTPGPASALGVDMPTWRQLGEDILRDLSTQPPYGIGWWAPHPGTSRRILISDHLYACTESVRTNMIESAIHWLKFLGSSDLVSDQYADIVKLVDGKLAVKYPRRESPLEELCIYTMRLHYVGCARALAGALDCMAGTIIGVLALPQPILKADFGRTRGLLKKSATAAATEGERVQASFGLELERLVNAAGPDGWLDWALAFRNMLVHRGRRIELGTCVPRTPLLYGADGQPVPRVRAVTHLPRDPGRSDVEVFLQPSKTPILEEDAEQTLDGLRKSTKSLVEGAAQQLAEVWKWRRAHPNSLCQPKAQWPDGASSESIGFSGYVPGSFPYSPSTFFGDPIILQRLRAAALDDASRLQWMAFD